MPRIVLGTTFLAITLLCFPAMAKDEAKKVKIKVGQTAPDFTLKNHKGKAVKLSELYKGKKKNVLLVFYPKDFTGG